MRAWSAAWRRPPSRRSGTRRCRIDLLQLLQPQPRWTPCSPLSSVHWAVDRFTRAGSCEASCAPFKRSWATEVSLGPVCRARLLARGDESAELARLDASDLHLVRATEAIGSAGLLPPERNEVAHSAIDEDPTEPHLRRGARDALHPSPTTVLHDDRLRSLLCGRGSL